MKNLLAIDEKTFLRENLLAVNENVAKLLLEASIAQNPPKGTQAGSVPTAQTAARSTTDPADVAKDRERQRQGEAAAESAGGAKARAGRAWVVRARRAAAIRRATMLERQGTKAYKEKKYKEARKLFRGAAQLYDLVLKQETTKGGKEYITGWIKKVNTRLEAVERQFGFGRDELKVYHDGKTVKMNKSLIGWLGVINQKIPGAQLPPPKHKNLVFLHPTWPGWEDGRGVATHVVGADQGIKTIGGAVEGDDEPGATSEKAAHGGDLTTGPYAEAKKIIENNELKRNTKRIELRKIVNSIGPRTKVKRGNNWLSEEEWITARRAAHNGKYNDLLEIIKAAQMKATGGTAAAEPPTAKEPAVEEPTAEPPAVKEPEEEKKDLLTDMPIYEYNFNTNKPWKGDPLRIRNSETNKLYYTKDKTAYELDEFVRFLGSNNWADYERKNKEDLKRGRVKPFHLYFIIREFKKNWKKDHLNMIDISTLSEKSKRIATRIKETRRKFQKLLREEFYADYGNKETITATINSAGKMPKIRDGGEERVFFPKTAEGGENSYFTKVEERLAKRVGIELAKGEARRHVAPVPAGRPRPKRIPTTPITTGTRGPEVDVPLARLGAPTERPETKADPGAKAADARRRANWKAMKAKRRKPEDMRRDRQRSVKEGPDSKL